MTIVKEIPCWSYWPGFRPD